MTLSDRSGSSLHAADQQPTPTTVARIDKAVADENAQAAPQLDPLIDALRDPSHPVLAVPATGIVGTCTPGPGFYHAEDLPHLRGRRQEV